VAARDGMPDNGRARLAPCAEKLASRLRLHRVTFTSELESAAPVAAAKTRKGTGAALNGSLSQRVGKTGPVDVLRRQ
jgi:hypothetical protein